MPKTIIHSVKLFDGEEIHENATVVFDQVSGTIDSVSTGSGAPQTTGDGEVIDGMGKTLLPGLIEGHMHCWDIHMPEGVGNSDVLRMTMKAGVTTVCDFHSDPYCVNNLRDLIKKETTKAKAKGKNGRVHMADLKTALLAATIQGGWPKPVVLSHHHTDPARLEARVAKWPNLTVETVPEYIKDHKANGANYIKLMQENCCSLKFETNSVPVASLELQKAVVDCAHEHGLPTVGHALSVDMTEVLLKAGIDGLAHMIIDQPPTENLMKLYKQTGAFLIPTFCALSALTTELQDYRERFADIYDRLGMFDDVVINRNTLLGVMHIASQQNPRASIEYGIENVKQLMAQGGDIVAGTDNIGGVPGAALGPGLWMELTIYIERCGMTTKQALASCTSTTARRFGFTDRGRVAQGLRADLLLVNGDLFAGKGVEALWEEDKGIAAVWREGIRGLH